jgi:hypothetical protein
MGSSARYRTEQGNAMGRGAADSEAECYRAT